MKKKRAKQENVPENADLEGGEPDDGTLQIIPYGASEVAIDGQTVQGWVTEGQCEKCNSPIFYDERYDSHFCGKCNEWHEEGCSDPNCGFCGKRPPRPLERQ